MKKSHLITLLLFLGFIFLYQETVDAQKSVQRKLSKIPGVVSVEELENEAPFSSKYLIWFEQPVDHSDPGAGTFLQRVFLFHNDFKAPMLITTEGYKAEYAKMPMYIDELAEHFKTNQIVVEHRYFGESVPKAAGWDPLTVENAAADHHRIVQAFKKRYNQKWISSGISKGGTTALIHRVFYPDDVDITVAYVAPLNFYVEDGRHESFIATNATHQLRAGITGFQFRVLLMRDSIMQYLNNYIEANELTFKIPMSELYDMLVLEYAFAFYQWGWDLTSIPDEDATAEEHFLHFMRVSPPEYFSLESSDYLPFFIQAARQLGYYNYEIRPFHNYMTIETTRGYLQRIFLPDSVNYTFDVSVSNRIQNFLETEDPKMIFIYGEWDPWSASAVVFDWREKKNMQKFVKSSGDHRARINNMPGQQKEQILEIIKRWLEEN